MIDVQTIYLREAATVRSIRAVAALMYPVPLEGTPTAVLVEDVQTSFILDGLGNILITLPPGNTKAAGWSVAVEVALAGGITKRLGYSASTQPIVEGLLLVTVVKAATVVEVRMNATPVLFTTASATSVLCIVPAGVTTLTSIDVLTSTPSMAATSTFEYRVVPNLQTVRGIQKLVFQFVKLLQTTQGSDILHQAEGGNLLSIIGSNITLEGTGSVGARAMLSIDNVAAQIILAQSKRTVPAEERLAKATIGSVTVDPEDSTSVTIGLRIESFSRDVAIFNFLLGKKG